MARTTRRLRIEWEPGAKVTGLLSGPGEGPVGVLLAHGAGAGQRHPFVAGMRRRLGDGGLPTLSFDYPYLEAGRRGPDPAARLLACHRGALARIAERVGRTVLVGKSMGGRIGGHLAAQDPSSVDRLVFLGYPLVPLGKTEPRDNSHLEDLDLPMLFVQGERDRLGPLRLVADLVDKIRNADLFVVAEADHGFRVPKRTGLDAEGVLDLLAAAVLRFVAG